MSKPNGRVVRMQQFRQQIEQAVLPPDGKVKVELADGGSVEFVVPIYLDGDDEYVQALQAAEKAEDAILAVLGEEQTQRWYDAGYTAAEFGLLFASEGRAAHERLQGFRYRPSGK